MNKYLILQHPGHNRVYYNLSAQLALSELKIASQRFRITCNEINITELKGIRYLSFSSPEEISTYDLQTLSRLSFIFAIFKAINVGEDIHLLPLPICDFEFVDSKISSLQKYNGKTNELFTKMMINIALLSSEFDYTDNIHLLDPVAGRGTTLYEGMIYGFDTTGIEIEAKSTHEIGVFIKKYFENERYKHLAQTRQVYGKTKSEALYIKEYEYSIRKEDFKTENLRKKLGIVTGPSQEAASYFKRESFHIIVGDLPYGIAHSNLPKQKSATLTRNPSELLSQCLPQWHQVLKKGGVVVMAWNSFVVAKPRLDQVFEANGFEVFKQAPYNDFEHLVDKSIKRNIVVAKKK